VQGHTANELNVKGHHVPLDLVLPHHKAGTHHSAASIFNDGKHFRQIVVEAVLAELLELFAGFVDAVVDAVAFSLVSLFPIGAFQFFQFVAQRSQFSGKLLTDFHYPVTQLIVVILAEGFKDGVDLIHNRKVALEVLAGFISEQLS